MNTDSTTLKNLSEAVLLEKTSRLASEERRISLDVILHLHEVGRRRAFAKLGYLSLYEYVVKELKFSEASAMRRIQAAQALDVMPELQKKLEKGSLSVTQVARVQSFVKRDEKVSGKKWSVNAKEELFEKAENSSRNELEKVLMEISPQAAVNESVKPVQEDLHEVKVFFTTAELNELNELRGLLGHQLKNPGSNSELLKKTVSLSLEAVVKKKTGGEKKMSEEKNVSENSMRAVSPLRRNGESNLVIQTRTVSVQKKRELFKRAGLQCEHLDPKTQIRCASKFKLEIDHRLPFALGGSNDQDHLRVLCKSHNLNRTRML